MSADGKYLAQAVRSLFLDEPPMGWFSSFPNAVSGLSAEQAASVPAPGFNSVWANVNHLCFWHETVLKRLRSIPVESSMLQAGQGWQTPNDPANEQAWKAACDRALALNRELSEQLAGMSDEELDQPVETWNESLRKSVISLIAHNSYHVCEIIAVRHMQGWWLNNV